jgi:hypothetical protein
MQKPLVRQWFGQHSVSPNPTDEMCLLTAVNRRGFTTPPAAGEATASLPSRLPGRGTFCPRPGACGGLTNTTRLKNSDDNRD